MNCSACGADAEVKIEYGSPVWGWNWACPDHIEVLKPASHNLHPVTSSDSA